MMDAHHWAASPATILRDLLPELNELHTPRDSIGNGGGAVPSTWVNGYYLALVVGVGGELVGSMLCGYGTGLEFVPDPCRTPAGGITCDLLVGSASCSEPGEKLIE